MHVVSSNISIAQRLLHAAQNWNELTQSLEVSSRSGGGIQGRILRSQYLIKVYYISTQLIGILNVINVLVLFQAFTEI